jgi:hypothetical protein
MVASGIAVVVAVTAATSTVDACGAIAVGDAGVTAVGDVDVTAVGDVDVTAVGDVDVTAVGDVGVTAVGDVGVTAVGDVGVVAVEEVGCVELVSETVAGVDAKRFLAIKRSNSTVVVSDSSASELVQGRVAKTIAVRTPGKILIWGDLDIANSVPLLIPFYRKVS